MDKKKIISVILTLAMLTSALGSSAVFAACGQTAEQTQTEAAAEDTSNVTDQTIDVSFTELDTKGKWVCLGSVDCTDLKALAVTVESTSAFHWNLAISDIAIENKTKAGEEISSSAYDAIFKTDPILAYASDQSSQTAALSVPSGTTGTQYIYAWVGGYKNTVSKFAFKSFTITKLSPYECSTSITERDGIVKATFNVDRNTTSKTFTGYLALYDQDGRVTEVKKTDEFGSGRETLSTEVPTDGEYVCKAYFWDGMNPVTNVSEKALNENSGFADTSNIRLTDGSLFEQSEEVGLEYIKNVDVDRLLAPSYEMHNLKAPNNASRYSGWERKKASNWGSSSDSYTLAGHSLGHWMSAAAVFYNATGDEEILEKLNYAVEKLDELQTQTGSAYIGGCPETTFTNCFAGKTNWASGYWVPWYGIHKIYQGLVDAYLYTDNDTAYTVLKKFADWAVEGTSKLTDSQMQSVLNEEYGGMNEIFALMYEFTGDEKYLNTGRRFTHDTILNPLISGSDSLSGLHANTQIPKIIGAAELYEQDPEKYASYKTASENFWNFVVNDRSYAIGGNSIAEHFEEKGLESLGVKTCESCNTYNMMRLTEHLFSWEHDSAYMDWYEDALYNHILGQQEPETGAKMYFVSLMQGSHRIYENVGESWWCCTGTGMENPGRYTRCAYYEDGDELYVNLYMADTYTWIDKGLTFTTETNYPYADTVNMKVTEGTGDATIKFRVPSWLTEDMTVMVGDESYTAAAEDGYLSVTRNWKAGDEIKITIPMSLRVYRSRNDQQIAYKYGPITLAADLGAVSDTSKEYTSNETKLDQGTVDVPYLKPENTDDESLKDLIELTDRDTLTFTLKGENNSGGTDISIKPFYGLHHEYYTVYWNLNDGSDPFEKAIGNVTTDKVQPDGQQDEIGHSMNTNTSDKVHQGSFTGNSKTYMYRDAWGTTSDDELPYFSYTLDVNENTKYLYIGYWGSDGTFSSEGKSYTRYFDILVDGVDIADETINKNRAGKVYNRFYDISEYVSGKENVTVTLRAKSTSSAACMLEMRTTTAKLDDDGNIVT